MLTKDDLQAIRGILKEEVPQIVKEQVGPIVKYEVNLQLKKELKPIHQKLNKLDKKIDLIARVLDNDIVSLDKRVTKLENKCFGSSTN